MGLYNFQSRFVPMVESGTKTHTIRAMRRFPDVPGKTLHLYTGLRQRGARLLKRARCTAVQAITITDRQRVAVDGVWLSADECDALARSDGFSDFAGMMRFWHGRLPFFGQIVHWSGDASALMAWRCM